MLKHHHFIKIKSALFTTFIIYQRQSKTQADKSEAQACPTLKENVRLGGGGGEKRLFKISFCPWLEQLSYVVILNARQVNVQTLLQTERPGQLEQSTSDWQSLTPFLSEMTKPRHQ